MAVSVPAFNNLITSGSASDNTQLLAGETICTTCISFATGALTLNAADVEIEL